jgi:hypothetical protein
MEGWLDGIMDVNLFLRRICILAPRFLVCGTDLLPHLLHTLAILGFAFFASSLVIRPSRTTSPAPSPAPDVRIHAWKRCEPERFTDLSEVERVHVKDLVQQVRRIRLQIRPVPVLRRLVQKSSFCGAATPT